MKIFLHYIKERDAERRKRENFHPLCKSETRCCLKKNSPLQGDAYLIRCCSECLRKNKREIMKNAVSGM
jgi:hypothetical protein